MNRWWGSTDDSSKQAASRDQRAANRDQRSARQTLQELNLNPFSDDEFEDCNTSIKNTSLFNLDGQADNDSVSSDNHSRPPSPAVTMAMDAAAIAEQKALPIQDSSYPDDADAWKKELKVK